MPKNFRKRKESSSSSEDEATESAAANTEQAESAVNIKEVIEDIKFVQKQRQRTHGLDVYSLAIGESSDNSSASLAARRLENDPWKSKTGGLVDMNLILEKRGNEIVRNMNSNFAKETNQRDEDAEMQKFIETQLRLRKEVERIKDKLDRGILDEDKALREAKAAVEGQSNMDPIKYKSPDDVLFELAKNLLNAKNKSEENFQEEILSGIPEVDLGIEERIRNIEETEKAKQSLFKARSESTASGEPGPKFHHHHNHHHHHHNHHNHHNHNHDHKHSKVNQQNEQSMSSVNFVQHKRFDETLINADKQRAQNVINLNNKQQQAKFDNQPVVGDAPKHELLQRPSTSHKRKGDFNDSSHHHHNHSHQQARPHTGASTNRTSSSGVVERATDDYCLERFKKNMKFNRNSKIKIA